MLLKWKLLGECVVFLMVLMYLRKGLEGVLVLDGMEGQLVNLKSFSKNHIDVEIQEKEENPQLTFTGFYRAPDVRDKAATWDLLRCLGSNNFLPWSVGGVILMIFFFLMKNKVGLLGRKLE